MKKLARSFTRVVDVYEKEGIRGVSTKGLRKIQYNLKKWTFRPYVMKKSICGETVSLLIGDRCAQDWYDRPHDWPELVWIKNNILRPEDVVVDCGAHQGLTTILFSKWATLGTVFGYEAHPRNAEIAIKNLAQNNVRNAKIRQCAVGGSIGLVQVSDHSNSAVLSHSNGAGIQVPIVDLDSEFSLLSPTFIKIDVEGQELNVLKGASRILKSRPKLDIEIHCSMHEDPLKELRDILRCISIDDYQAFIQLAVDGPIEKYDPGLHTDEYISQHEVVHLFCTR
jgi:FkbM family methyltransferase